MNIIKCTSCKIPLAFSPFQMDREKPEATLCTACLSLERAEKEGTLHPTKIDDRRKYITRDWLLPYGDVPPRLYESARMKGIPMGTRQALEPHLPPIWAGRVPTKGFGLLGSQGSRKSGTQVALLRTLSTRRALRLVGEETYDLPHRPVDFLWVDWPATYGELGRSWGDPKGVTTMLRRMQWSGLLILDDLGRESIRKSDDESTPFAMGIFQELISYRNSNRLPIWWNSNCDIAGLASIYDGATLGRLFEDNPPIILPDDIPNYRLPGIQ